MKLTLILPLYNEVENIPKIEEELLPVVDALSQTSHVEVLLIDDGSSDGTWDALVDTFSRLNRHNLEFRFERHSINQGLGAALRTGFAASTGDVIITTDGDGSYHFNEIPNLLSHLQPDVDIVTASPYHPDGNVEGVAGYRLLLSRGSSFLYRILVDWRINTFTCLFRAYRREVIEKITVESDGYRGVTEILVKALLMGYRAGEYPATLHKRSLGTSKVRLIQTILDHLRFQALILFHRINLKPMVVQTMGSRET